MITKGIIRIGEVVPGEYGEYGEYTNWWISHQPVGYTLAELRAIAARAAVDPIWASTVETDNAQAAKRGELG